MSNSIVAAIYRHVIEDVVRNVHDDFEGHGVDISVLEELQRSWEAKIVQSRVAAFPNDDPYQSNGSQPHIPTGPGAVDPTASYYGGYPANSSVAATANNGNAAGNNINSAASLASIIHSESMAPSAASLASLAQSGRGQPSLLDDDEDSHNNRGGYNYHHHIPQNDGPPDENSQHKQDGDDLARWRSLCTARRTGYQRDLELASKNLKESTSIPQTDGASDGGSEETKPNNNTSSTADEDRKNLSLPQTKHEEEEEKEKVEENPDELINSDLDDSDDEDDYEDGAEDTEHVILCQYDKVTRTKNKWKCVLRDGIMLINGRDYLFQKANGDFEW